MRHWSTNTLALNAIAFAEHLKSARNSAKHFIFTSPFTTSRSPYEAGANIISTLSGGSWVSEGLIAHLMSNKIFLPFPNYGFWKSKRARSGADVRGHRYFSFNKHFPSMQQVWNQDNSSIAHFFVSLAPLTPWFRPWSSIPNHHECSAWRNQWVLWGA